jgi:hypothetical protein
VNFLRILNDLVADLDWVYGHSGLERFRMHRELYLQIQIRRLQWQSANEIFDAVPGNHEGKSRSGIKDGSRHIQRGNMRNLGE